MSLVQFKRSESRSIAPRGPMGRLQIDVVSPAEWDALLDLFEDVNYEQTSIFTARQWGSKNTVCVVVRDGGELVGGACYGRVRVPGIGAVAFTKFGPVWRARGAEATPERYRCVIEALCRHADGEKIALTIIPRAHPVFTEVECGELRRLGFATRERMNGDHYIVDASLPADAQMSSLGQTWRANLRKAEKSGVTITELPDGQYAEFERLYAQMTQRKNVLLLRPVDVVPALASGLPETLRPKGLIAHHDGEPVAGIIYGVLGDTAYYLYGATNAKALPVRAGYKLQWAVLERIRGDAAWYDLGQSSGDDGMRQFKSGLIGKGGALVEIPSEFDYAASWRAKLALRMVYGLREVRRALLRIRRSLQR